MTSDADWAAGTWEGSRRLQHRAFQELSFREKVAAIEAMSETIAQVVQKRGMSPGEQGPPGHGRSQSG